MDIIRKTFHFELPEFFAGCSVLERSLAVSKANIVSNILQLSILLSHIREEFPYPIKINSCYRDSGHNASVGGNKSSQHLTGSAVDFRIEFPPYCLDDLDHVVFWIRNYLVFGQLIQYDTFLHLSLPRSGKPNYQYIDKRSKK